MNTEILKTLCPARLRNAIATLRHIAEFFDRQQFFGRNSIGSGCRNHAIRTIDGWDTVVFCAVGCLMDPSDAEANAEGQVCVLPPEIIAKIHDSRRDNTDALRWDDLSKPSREAWVEFLTALQLWHDHKSSPNGDFPVEHLEIHRLHRFTYALWFLAEQMENRWATSQSIRDLMLDSYSSMERSHLSRIMDGALDFAKLR